ncbi:MarR family winged helix-turn-helix transcriptional regulator [Nocardia jejuensis]|uniref:MarR family winged helix-turn-helix transcriptional regulator n=1 Tax=Nocardia jejuensis TaxID=328049 RepID=UPI000836F348|nr:MarR family winged helix-turn-helix transcriptional regulator [Nocardia jejuensis]
MGQRERERALWDAFFPMNAELWQALTRRLQQDTGLSEPDWQVLNALGNTDGHTLRAFELAKVLMFGKSRLHQHVGRMEQRGLVERGPVPGDARATVVYLTPQGLSTFRRAQAHRARHIREELVGALTADEVEQLTTLSYKIRAHVRRDRPS